MAQLILHISSVKINRTLSSWSSKSYRNWNPLCFITYNHDTVQTDVQMYVVDTDSPSGAQC